MSALMPRSHTDYTDSESKSSTEDELTEDEEAVEGSRSKVHHKGKKPVIEIYTQ